MPNIASILKIELSRIARREVRAETSGLKKAVAAQRAEIAALKRRVQTLERELKRATKANGKRPTSESGIEARKTRFSAKSLASQRHRLGLSAADCGLLVGASGQSVYQWESGKVRPRPKHLAAIAALRLLGKKDVAARLGALRRTT